jgi:osmotically-inducible protein OsmY
MGTPQRMRTTRLLLGVAIGAGAEYLLDPQLGTRRRARLRDQAAARVRRARRGAARRASYERGQQAGEAARAAGQGVFHPVSDRQVADHLHETLARLEFPTSDVTVEVSDATATLRGQVSDAGQRDVIIEAVRSHPGVDSVRSWLHLPGEPAPNKVAAYQASAAGAQ